MKPFLYETLRSRFCAGALRLAPHPRQNIRKKSFIFSRKNMHTSLHEHKRKQPPRSPPYFNRLPPNPIHGTTRQSVFSYLYAK